MNQKAGALLQEFWGYTAFRPLQEDIIEAVLAGENVLAVLPTGAGKSICYQLPALVLGGITLVVSPLIALMQDQVAHLKKRGISAACLYSGMSQEEISDVLRLAVSGDIRLLYVAPERLLSEAFLAALSEMEIRLVAIDEAHCISQWGHDFRPAYLEIRKIKPFLSQKPVWMALTATATLKVRQEILDHLAIPHAKIFHRSVYRANLSYGVEETEAKLTAVVQLFQSQKGSGILYCGTRRLCLEMRHWLQKNGIKTIAYHAGMPKSERMQLQERWTKADDIVVCATSAFGMGIDKENVATVAHLAPPDSLEAYYQEAGRAGRNGQPARCVLFFHKMDIEKLNQLPSLQYPGKKFVLSVYQKVCDALRIPLAAGKDESFPFDVIAFVKKFQLELLPTLSALRILEKSGYWLWEQESQLRSTILVTASTEEIEQLKTIKPSLAQVLVALLRLHAGIFNFPVVFKIWDMAKYLKIEQKTVLQAIRQLDGMGLVRYTAAISGSYLYFLESRCRPHDLLINVQRLKTLRKALSVRVHNMIEYLTEDKICRNELLAKYFGESTREPCGKCDNCMKNNWDDHDFKKVQHWLKEKLQEQPENDIQNLSSQAPGMMNKFLVETLRSLEEEGYCRILPNGRITVS